MTDQNTFMELVQNVAEIVKTAEAPMTEEEILVYFADMDLDENQKKLVLDYIATAEEREQEDAELAEEKMEAASDEEEMKSKVFQMYLEELAMLPAFTASDRMQLYNRLAAGDADVIETISTAWLKKVLTIAEKYIEPGVNVEDLVQEGNMSLFLKLQELLGEEQVENMEDELTSAVEEGIVRYCSEMVGERQLENTLVGKISLVHEAKKVLVMEKGQEPTLKELADYTKMTEDELLEIEDFLKNGDK